MKKEDFQGLVEKYLSGSATDAEQRLLEEYYARLVRPVESMSAEVEENLRRQMLESIFEKAGISGSRLVPARRIGWKKYAAAASVLFILGTGVYYLFFHKPPKEIAKTNIPAPVLKNDIAAPKGTKTTLTLASGQVITLDSMQNGAIATQGGSNVSKLDSAQLAYNSLDEKPTEVLHNTLSTARGGRTTVVLADGSKVWLNALSSLKFPTAFIGTDREVELTGEAYFEIAKNPKMPFHVNMGGSRVEVLGTHFNVMAYDNEKEIKTTLLEGSIKITKDKESKLLKPGEQAVISKTNGDVQVQRDVDTDEAVAWKNGLFQFNSLDVESIMRQISRWYDVDVSYQGKIAGDHFTGVVSRSGNVSEVLKIMEQANIHFTIQGNKITVMP